MGGKTTKAQSATYKLVLLGLVLLCCIAASPSVIAPVCGGHGQPSCDGVCNTHLGYPLQECDNNICWHCCGDGSVNGECGIYSDGTSCSPNPALTTRYDEDCSACSNNADCIGMPGYIARCETNPDCIAGFCEHSSVYWNCWDADRQGCFAQQYDGCTQGGVCNGNYKTCDYTTGLFSEECVFDSRDEFCHNTLDDDCDGDTDCADSECDDDLGCQETACIIAGDYWLEENSWQVDDGADPLYACCGHNSDCVGPQTTNPICQGNGDIFASTPPYSVPFSLSNLCHQGDRVDLCGDPDTPWGTRIYTVQGWACCEGGAGELGTWTYNPTSHEDDWPNGCFDGLDNDCDQLADCDDEDCASLPECQNACTPVYYNGCDKTDGCGVTRTTTPYNDCNLTSNTRCRTETRCTDLIDEDCDGLQDCLDPDCSLDPTCVECVDDEDCEPLWCPSINGTLQGTCFDYECVYEEPPYGCVTECSDGVDNDGDGFIDFGPLCDDYCNQTRYTFDKLGIMIQAECSTPEPCPDPGCESFADDNEYNDCFCDEDCVDVCPDGWPWPGICEHGWCEYDEDDCDCHAYYWYYDYNNDGFMNGTDVSILVGVVFGNPCPLGRICDVNADGVVNNGDVLRLQTIIDGDFDDGEICDDGIDNNCNGLIDEQDPDCGGSFTYLCDKILHLNTEGAGVSIINTIQKITGLTTPVLTFNENLYSALAADEDGTLYAYRPTSGIVLSENSAEISKASQLLAASPQLVRLNEDETITTIGATGIPGPSHSLEFAPDGTLYTFGDQTNSLYRVDTSTGSATLLKAYTVLDASGGDLIVTEDNILYYVRVTGQVYKIDLHDPTYAATQIGALPTSGRYSSAAYFEGVHYALDVVNEKLYTIQHDPFSYTVVAGQNSLAGPYWYGDGTMCPPEPAPFCGDGIINPGEMCDNGTDNGQECTAGYNETCMWCTLNCTVINETGAYCGDGVKDEPYEECDGTDGVPAGYVCTDTCTLIQNEANIIAHKIVCDDEADLPNWGVGGPSITQHTATNWVVQHPGCRLEPDWQFQWAPFGTNNPGDTFYGLASSPWTTFGPTNQNGSASTTIPVPDGEKRVWIREALQEGYIPFSYGQNNHTNVDDFSAETYCHIDVLNYDNYDRVDEIEPQETYYCISWNTLLPYCGDGVLNPGEECDLNGNNSIPCTPGYNETCDWCSGDCLNETAIGPYCGDGLWNTSYEECDGVLGVPPNYLCTAECTLEYVPFCGDNITDPGEECDLNGLNGIPCNPPYNATCEWCSDTCTNETEIGPYCGDGLWNTTYEECDGTLGVPIGYECLDNCTLYQLPFCGDGNLDPGEQCDNATANGNPCDPPYNGTCNWCTFNCLNETEIGPYCGDNVTNTPPEECDGDDVPAGYICTDDCHAIPNEANIVASKIYCDNESDLPNWGFGGPSITETTAVLWVADHPGCRFEPDWYFQWAPNSASNPGDDLYGEAGAPWTTFGPTNENGTTTITVPVPSTPNMWMREVLQDDFIPFTYGTNNNSNADDSSAEIYCHDDVLNYDNYDRINNMEAQETYYCVAWNTIDRYCGDGNLDPGEQCDENGNNSIPCNPLYNETCEWCSFDCRIQNETGPYCGDGIWNTSYEECDGLLGVPNHYTCTAECTLEYVPYCGDGNLDPGEACELNGTWAGWGPPGFEYTCNENNTYDQCVECQYEYVNECSYYCSGALECDGLAPGTELEMCDYYGFDYLQDYCDNNCELADDNCESNYTGCTAEPECDEVEPNTGDCNYMCEYKPLPVCGNGIPEWGEECDVGLLNGDVCSPPYADTCEWCSVNCTTEIEDGPYCGDGLLNLTFEECDLNGLNGVPCDPLYNETCEWCDTSCSTMNETGPYCGDGLWNETYEQCDGLLGVPENYVCTAECTLEYVPYCGDNVTNLGEECDGFNGIPCTPLYNETCTWCSETCMNVTETGPFCGDNSTQDPPEQCDLNGLNGISCDPLYNETCGWCDNSCMLQNETGPYCGDGILNETYEECDVNGLNGIQCTPLYNETCNWCTGSCGNATETGPYCGDGILNETYEQCDLNGLNGVPCNPLYNETCAWCNTTCLSINESGPYCGDGILNETYEQCDLNGNNSIPCIPGYNETCSWCSGDCLNETAIGPYCGDELWNTTYEECDGILGVPNTDYSCAANCTLIYTPICEDIGYLGPYVQSNVSQWMDTVSRIEITDGGEELCNGTGYTYYKNTWLQGDDEHYCAGDCAQWIPSGYETGSWETYQGPFSGGNESCHIIEYYNEDANGNRTPILWDCIYMDKTPPELEKTVGQPKSVMSQRNKELGAAFYPELMQGACDEDGVCWDITLLTAIDMTCTDAEPHPSGVVELCFNVDFDNEDVTDEYCNGTNGEMKGGDCCLEDDGVNFHFTKISWHKLSYYCVDAVNKTSDPDVEYFKVEETTFDIQLNKKWNLISVPVRLLDDSMDEIFAGLEDTVVSVWQFDGENWHIYTPDNVSNDDLTTMLPGYGYWILTTKAATLTIGGSLFNPAVIAPEIPITHGWNLVGYYGSEGINGYDGPDGAGRSAECLFSSFGDSLFDKGFTSVYGYWEPFNPNLWQSYGRQDNLDPGAGYWVFATEDSIYGPPPADCS